MAHDEHQPVTLSSGEIVAAQIFWYTAIGVLLFAGAAFFILV